MPDFSFPFAVRLIGFSSEEDDHFAMRLSRKRNNGYGYFHLADDNLQDPDLYVVNAIELRALAVMSDLSVSDVRPVLLVGTPSIELPYPRIDRPIRWHKLFQSLDNLIEKRADTLSRLQASDIVSVSERRRGRRLDIDLTDSSEYARMRTARPNDGAIMVVDKNPALRAYLADLLKQHDIPVMWAPDGRKTVELCNRKHISVAIVNTSTPGIDPYQLCKMIRQASRVEKMMVIFLIGKSPAYDRVLAREAGADGFLNKPVARHHLVSVLKKFLPQLSR
ncbi:MAG TPA: response regulator [Burkholderiaceae bacterium]|nr:response regulator [Burkholderiaceae bacterium]